MAEFDDGCEILGESKIAMYKKYSKARIRRVRLLPEKPPALSASIEAIKRAEMIIIGPGSLYTSLIPNLLTGGSVQAIVNSNALRVYVLNVMTQDGETEGYTASDHIKALFAHSNAKLFDYCLANNLPVPGDILERYRQEDAEPTVLDKNEIKRLGVELVCAPVADWRGGFARHDPDALARELIRLFHEKSPTRVYS
jgi:uncharacterized cofD-like protein